MKKKIFPLALLLVNLVVLGQTEAITTTTGKYVLLNDDGTWSYKNAVNDKVVKDSQEPKYNLEYTSTPYYIINDSVKKFEKVKPNVEAKTVAMGYGGVETYYVTFNSKSNVRLNQNPKIIIKSLASLDLSDYISIVKTTEYRRNVNKRRFIRRSSTLTGTVRNTSKTEMPFSIKKLGDNTYEIVIEKVLEKGEYAIIPMLSGMKMFCFAID